jgi:thiol-disulfide isomerase/thioredoxin
MDATFLQAKHDAGLSYARYVAAGTAAQQQNWQKVYQQVKLTGSQEKLVGLFTRKINVLVLTGIWCGDCVQQGPLLERIAEANPRSIDLRWLERDAHLDLQERVRICGGQRVPVVIFCAEDFELVGWFGDRTLARYRAVAQRQLGASCPLPGAVIATEELAATLQDWVDQFERIHLLLRLSPRLRQKHGD